MKKLLAFVVLCLGNAFALDLTGLPVNTDKSTFETLNYPSILMKKEAMFFFSYEIQKNPIMLNNQSPVDGLQNFSLSAIYGLSNRFELGASLLGNKSFISDNSLYNEYSDLSHASLELKTKLWKDSAIILGFSNGFSSNELIGRSGQLGEIKFSSTIGDYVFNIGGGSTFGDVAKQETEYFFGLGRIFTLHEYVDLGVEVFRKQTTENLSNNEILTHLSIHKDDLMIRSGVGYGLNSDKHNEFRFLITVGFSFDLNSKKQSGRQPASLNSDDLNRVANVVSHNAFEEGDDNAVVLPFFTVKEIKEEKNKKNKLDETYATLEYFIDLHKNNKISDERAQKEFNWSLHLLKIRSKNSETTLDPEKVQYLVSYAQNFKIPPKELSEEEIKKHQELAWEYSKTHTIQDIIQEKRAKVKSKKEANIVQDVVLIEKPEASQRSIADIEVESIIVEPIKIEQDLEKEKALLVFSLNNGLNQKPIITENVLDKIFTHIVFDVPAPKTEEEETTEDVDKLFIIQRKDDQPVEVVIEEKGKEIVETLGDFNIQVQEDNEGAKERFLRHYYEGSGGSLVEDGYIEKSTGPAY